MKFKIIHKNGQFYLKVRKWWGWCHCYTVGQAEAPQTYTSAESAKEDAADYAKHRKQRKPSSVIEVFEL